MTPFYTILTNYGKTVLAEALAAQQPLKIPHMAVGDGGGEYYEPTENQTNLRNERWRGELNDLRTDEELQGQVIAEAIIPHDIEDGDWTAREIGLFDARGGLVAVGKYPETYIPSALSGAKSQVYINIIIKVDNVAAVELIVNHDTVLASKDYVHWIDSNLRGDLVRVVATFESILEMISDVRRYEGKVVRVISYHTGLGIGGGEFIWSDSTSKSQHNGGYIIDPDIPIPNIENFDAYYSPRNDGVGVWIRTNKSKTINTSEFGAIPNNPKAVWFCAAAQSALKYASVSSINDPHPHPVKTENGKYYTTNPIIQTTNEGYSARLPAFFGGDGTSIYDVEIHKITDNTVGDGFLGGDVDAVIYVSPTTDRGDHVYGESTKGFTLTRKNKDVGYGYFAIKSVMGGRGNINAVEHGYNIYTDDCWMSELGLLRASRGIKGIAIRGGTSNKGGFLYCDGCSEEAFDFRGLTYSELNCASDGCGHGLPDGATAYDFSFCKSVSGIFSSERHKGTEFNFHYSDGVIIRGRSYHTTPVLNSVFKITINGASVYTFDCYNWKETFANTGAMTPPEIAKYSFSNRNNYTSSAHYANCLFNDAFAKDGYLAQIDSKFTGSHFDTGYINQAGLVVHTLLLSNSEFKRLCYVGRSSSIELLSANSINPTLNRYYANPFPLSTTPVIIPNVKPSRLMISQLSNDVNSPTSLFVLYNNNTPSANYLLGYIDSEGWLRVKPSNTGNAIEYKFIIVT